MAGFTCRLNVILFFACITALTEYAYSYQGDEWPTLNGQAPLVIAHRGASGVRPEHSLLSYQKALDMGADILEPDLHMSADHKLIVRHDPFLSTSTDIADRPEFLNRRVERFGRTDWWISDFSSEELRTLKTRQVMPDRMKIYDNKSPVLTFEDFLNFVAEQENRCNCQIIIAPEIKIPSVYEAIGLDPLSALIAILESKALNSANAPIIIQSFDAQFLQRLNQVSSVRLVMLRKDKTYKYPEHFEPDIKFVSEFADMIGAHKGLIINFDGTSTGYIEAAHNLGLGVHVWTVRDDQEPITGRSVEDELRALFALGVDGVFTDHPDTALKVRNSIR